MTARQLFHDKVFIWRSRFCDRVISYAECMISQVSKNETWGTHNWWKNKRSVSQAESFLLLLLWRPDFHDETWFEMH
jgi:hypothetical protein